VSAISRIVSGSAAAWTRIGITFLVQIFLVPVFLSHWDASTYGIWLGLFALASFLQFVDIGHHNYVAYEALRLGSERRADLALLYKSAVVVAIWSSAVQVTVVACLIALGYHAAILRVDPSDEQMSRAIGVLLLLFSVSWLLFGNWSTVAGQVLSPFGYYPNIAWWQVCGSLATAVCPAIAVSLGAGLLIAGLTYHIAHAVWAVLVVAYVHSLVRREGLTGIRVDYRFGLRNFVRSLALSLRAALEMLRQDQFKIVLAPLLGPATLTLFATTRTLANVFLAALASVTGPLMPEFMRYLNNGDEEKSAAGMSFVWIVLLAVLAPLAVAAQVLAAPLFEAWTRGKVAYDPTLFAIFSVQVLVAALGQPAMAVIQGRNLLRPQVIISLSATAIVLPGTIYLGWNFGITGAATSLLISELFVCAAALWLARRVFQLADMQWPTKQVRIATIAVASYVVMIAAASRSMANKELIITSAFACGIVASILLILSLPAKVRRTALSGIQRHGVTR
jgi:O-antigen/teichoic acid export membrane protein